MTAIRAMRSHDCPQAPPIMPKRRCRRQNASTAMAITRALSPASDRSMMTMPNQRARTRDESENSKDGPLNSVQLSDGIDATGGSPRSRRHQGVMMAICIRGQGTRGEFVLLSDSAISRAIWSAPPPVPAGMTNSMGFVGSKPCSVQEEKMAGVRTQDKHEK